jgi:chromosome segregation ATPase
VKRATRKQELLVNRADAAEATVVEMRSSLSARKGELRELLLRCDAAESQVRVQARHLRSAEEREATLQGAKEKVAESLSAAETAIELSSGENVDLLQSVHVLQSQLEAAAGSAESRRLEICQLLQQLEAAEVESLAGKRAARADAEEVVQGVQRLCRFVAAMVQQAEALPAPTPRAMLRGLASGGSPSRRSQRASPPVASPARAPQGLHPSLSTVVQGLVEMRAAVGALVTQRDELVQQVTELTAGSVELRDQLQNKTREAEQAASSSTRMDTALREATQEVTSLRASLTASQQQLSGEKQKVLRLQTGVSRASKACSAAEAQRLAVRDREDRLHASVVESVTLLDAAVGDADVFVRRAALRSSIQLHLSPQRHSGRWSSGGAWSRTPAAGSGEELEAAAALGNAVSQATRRIASLQRLLGDALRRLTVAQHTAAEAETLAAELAEEA